MPAEAIKISGARQHNLKNLHVEIPRERLVVIAGLVRGNPLWPSTRFMPKDKAATSKASRLMHGNFSVEWKSRMWISFRDFRRPSPSSSAARGANPRSTIATTTEIYDYLRVLFSAVGQPHDPQTGQPLSRQTPQQIADQILGYERESKIILLAPLIEDQPGEFRDIIEKIRREGFVRAGVDGQMDRPERIRLNKNKRHTIEAVVDRLVVRDGIRIRLTDSIETALKWRGNRVVVLRQARSDGVIKKWSNEKITTPTLQDSSTPTVEWEELRYSTDYGNAETGLRIGELTPRHFF
jgi:excinuclease ABC subunit A